MSQQELARKPCGCPENDAISRRSFLQRAGVAGAAGFVAGLASPGAFTKLAFAATPYTGDVLVVLSLRGGFDGLQAIVPAADPNYLAARPNIGIPPNTLLQLDQTFGMHPAMAPLKPLWDAGTFGVVHAVGQEQPNRSHFEAMEELERAAPGSSTRTGWIDRMLGLRDPGTAFQGVQIGSSMAAPAFLGPSPELAMSSIDDFGLSGAWDATELSRWDTALRGIHQGASDLLSGPASVALDAVGTTTALAAAGYVPENGAVYDEDSHLARTLRDLARLIKADVGLQVAAVDYGDWDMHEGMGTVAGGWMTDHLTELSLALAAFATDLGTKLAEVTVVSLTEFGRRVDENGSGGTDHGFGQLALLLGGGVRGGKIHGQWPGLAPADLIDGDLNGVNDYRLLLAEILEKRCGASASNVSNVFPGLGSARLDVVKPVS
jgi:uncharacterized protein (DUF1501 family)